MSEKCDWVTGTGEIEQAGGAIVRRGEQTVAVGAKAKRSDLGPVASQRLWRRIVPGHYVQIDRSVRTDHRQPASIRVQGHGFALQWIGSRNRIP